MEAVAWSAGRKASSRNSATVTSTTVPKWVRVVSSWRSPWPEERRRGTAKPRCSGPGGGEVAGVGLEILVVDDHGRIRIDHQFIEG